MLFTFDRELVKDCIQDVFVKMYSNRPNLKKVSNVKAYLFIAFKNTLFNFLIKEKQYYCLDTIKLAFTSEYNIEEDIITSEQENEWKREVDSLLGLLTPRQREAIYYRYEEGMGLKEICKLMNMNYQSVQNLIQRSIKKVKNAAIQKNANKYRMMNIRLSKYK